MCLMPKFGKKNSKRKCPQLSVSNCRIPSTKVCGTSIGKKIGIAKIS